MNFFKADEMASWNQDQMPDLSGKTVVVTGANSGIGLAAVEALAAKGARVIMAVRNPQRGEYAKTTVQSKSANSQVELATLDLASFESIEEFSLQFGSQPLDILINNAGVMAIPYGETAQGFETQMGVNHLGHSLLTAKLLKNLRLAPNPRVVTITSFAHRGADLKSGDKPDLLRSPDRYSPWVVYSNSKLANIFLARHLDKIAKDQSWGLISVAAHPGYANTNLQYVAPSQRGGLAGSFGLGVVRFFNNTVAQSAQAGAWPTLMAATDPNLRGGELVGPKAIMQFRGSPGVVDMSAKASDGELRSRVMATTEDLIEMKVS